MRAPQSRQLSPETPSEAASYRILLLILLLLLILILLLSYFMLFLQYLFRRVHIDHVSGSLPLLRNCNSMNFPKRLELSFLLAFLEIGNDSCVRHVFSSRCAHCQRLQEEDSTPRPASPHSSPPHLLRRPSPGTSSVMGFLKME